MVDNFNEDPLRFIRSDAICIQSEELQNSGFTVGNRKRWGRRKILMS
jgi:hypothetical protein